MLRCVAPGLWLCLVMGVGMSINAADSYPAPAPPDDVSRFGEKFQRTMRLLAESSPTKRNRVKILFYGQSITAGDWWQRVANDLRERFPHADLDIQNKAIGGFSSQRLYRTAVYDVYPEYPDLVIFHVFGADTCYEQLIAGIRANTAAEVVIWTDHLNGRLEPNADGEYVDTGWTKHIAAFLPKVAEKYDCGLIEIREPWKKYLLENDLKPSALLKDNIHLNDHGGYLAAELLSRALVHNPELPLGPSENLVRDIVVGRDVKWEDGKLVVPFDGNRVDLIPLADASGKAPVKVLIDGEPPSRFPGCYSHTRPSKAYGTFGPAIKRIGFNERLLIEDWTIRVTGYDRDTKVCTFEAIGSETGRDGTGSTDQDFVSDSGRVVVKAHVKPDHLPEQSDWRFEGEVPVGFEVKWKTIGMFVDRYQPPAITDTTRERATRVAQGFDNGKHTLTLVRDGEGEDGVAAIRIYRPPVSKPYVTEDPSGM